MIVTGNFKMALDAIRTSKMRSFLTMLGVVIGVTSVVTVVSIGEGVKKQISDQISLRGPDLIVVRPGQVGPRGAAGAISEIMGQNSKGNIGESDVSVIRQETNTSKMSPVSIVGGIASVKGKDFPGVNILGTTNDFADLMKLEIEYGSFFSPQDSSRDVAVIGQHVAEEIFGSTAPTGQSFKIRGRSFVVVGVLEKTHSTPLASDYDLNNSIIIPFDSSKTLSDGQSNIIQILVKPADPSQSNAFAKEIHSKLKEAHSGQVDFAVLTQEANKESADRILNILTIMTTGIASISLLVGGIGIMNVMLVSVAERTREIGVRKSVGATNQQILTQFAIESSVVSLVGGVVGVLVSILANYILRVTTNLEPLINLNIIMGSLILALAVGLIFGLAPAIKASRKDPIEALRTGS